MSRSALPSPYFGSPAPMPQSHTITYRPDGHGHDQEQLQIGPDGHTLTRTKSSGGSWWIWLLVILLILGVLAWFGWRGYQAAVDDARWSSGEAALATCKTALDTWRARWGAYNEIDPEGNQLQVGMTGRNLEFMGLYLSGIDQFPPDAFLVEELSANTFQLRAMMWGDPWAASATIDERGVLEHHGPLWEDPAEMTPWNGAWETLTVCKTVFDTWRARYGGYDAADLDGLAPQQGMDMTWLDEQGWGVDVATPDWPLDRFVMRTLTADTFELVATAGPDHPRPNWWLAITETGEIAGPFPPTWDNAAEAPPAEPSEEEVVAEAAGRLRLALLNCSTTASRFQVLERFMLDLDEFPPAMREVWEAKLQDVADETRADIYARAAQLEGADAQETQQLRDEMKMQGLVWLGWELINRFDAPDIARPYLDEALAIAETHAYLTQEMSESRDRARQLLGWRQIEISYPDGSDLERAFFDGLLDELVNEWDGRWVSPEDYERFEQQRAAAEEDALELVRLWEDDRFLARLFRMRLNMRNNIWFRNFDFEIVDARPYGLLIARHETMTDEQYDMAVQDRQQTLANYWQFVRARFIEGWNLESNMEDDTPDNPQPFIFINFANRDQLDDFFETTSGNPLPEFARAYYSRQTEAVYYYETEQYNPNDFNVCMHEATHQFFDRYSAEGIDPAYVRTHLLNEGMAEYAAGYQGDASDPQYPGINQMRVPGIVNFQRQLNGRRLPWGEDWCLWPLAYLWQPADIPSLMYTGQHVARQYAQAGYPGHFLAQWQDIWHSFFYSYAWAFCYYMMEVSEYNEAFQEYCRQELTNPEDGGAELFCRVMGWEDLAEELAEHPLHTLLLRPHEDTDWEAVQQESIARANLMNRHEGVQALQTAWFEWMKNGMIDTAREQGANIPE